MRFRLKHRFRRRARKKRVLYRKITQSVVGICLAFTPIGVEAEDRPFGRSLWDKYAQHFDDVDTTLASPALIDATLNATFQHHIDELFEFESDGWIPTRFGELEAFLESVAHLPRVPKLLPAFEIKPRLLDKTFFQEDTSEELVSTIPMISQAAYFSRQDQSSNRSPKLLDPSTEYQAILRNFHNTSFSLHTIDTLQGTTPNSVIPGGSLLTDPFFNSHNALWSPAEISQRVGGVNVGDGFIVTGESYDQLNSPYLEFQGFNTPGFELVQDGLSVNRVGVHRGIFSDHVMVYYAFEQASLFGVNDDPGFAETNASPRTGENHRFGLQTQTSDGRWAFVASGYFAESGDLSGFFPSTGWESSRGMELAIRTKVMHGWNTTLSFSEVSTNVIDRDQNGFLNIPRSSSAAYLTLWNQFHLYQKEDRKLTLALGTRFSESYRSSFEDSLLFPGYSRWDLGLFYKQTGLEARLYVESFLDSGYYDNFNTLLNDPDSPLSIRAQIRLNY